MSERPPVEMSDASDFEEAYRRHYQAVYRTCRRFAAGDREWAMDVTQDTFLRLAERLPELDESVSIAGWLNRVAVNLCVDRLRRYQVLSRISSYLPSREQPKNPERELQEFRDLERVEHELARLPDRERMIVVLIHWMHMTQEEAAAQVGYSRSYTAKLYQRALSRLRRAHWEVDDET